MAVVNYQRILDGANLSGKFGESIVATERWQVRVDTPATSKLAILTELAAFGGIVWGMSHPDISALKAMEFDLSSEGREGMRWILTVKFYVPPPTRLPQSGTAIPADVWEFTGGTSTVPAFRDNAGTVITNAAGDPLEGLERERHDFAWTLRKSYSTEAAFTSAAAAYPGTVNSATWAGGAAKTWKCYLRGAKKVNVSTLDATNQGTTGAYIEASWEFRYDPQTWKCMPWNVGFMELVSGTRKVILADGKPVKQPVALTNSGTKASDGTAPSVINSGNGVDLYPTANFTTGFGTPAMLT
jgi:hypothetical protein